MLLCFMEARWPKCEFENSNITFNATHAPVGSIPTLAQYYVIIPCVRDARQRFAIIISMEKY